MITADDFDITKGVPLNINVSKVSGTIDDVVLEMDVDPSGDFDAYLLFVPGTTTVVLPMPLAEMYVRVRTLADDGRPFVSNPIKIVPPDTAPSNPRLSFAEATSGILSFSTVPIRYRSSSVVYRTISGAVTLDSEPLEGVLISVIGGNSALTDSSGNYIIINIIGDPVTISAEKFGYTFTPPAIEVVFGTDNAVDQNFSAEAVATTASVSGTITDGVDPISGVSVVTDGRGATTDSSGNYTITGIPFGLITVVPSHPAYTFSPVDFDIDFSGDTIDIDFTGTLVATTHSISGTILLGGSGLAGIRVETTGGLFALTNGSGAYTINDVPDGSVTVTPIDPGYTFSPTDLAFTLSANATGKDFTATAVPSTASVSGNITLSSNPLPGITVNATGGFSAVTDASGNYTISGVPFGSVTVTPASGSHTFTPTSLTFTLGAGGAAGKDFVATAIAATSTIGGHTWEPTTLNPIPGIRVNVDTGHFGISNASGVYNIPSVPNGTRTVTPSVAGYTWTPAFRTFAMSGNALSKNFEGVGVAASGIKFTSGDGLRVFHDDSRDIDGIAFMNKIKDYPNAGAAFKFMQLELLWWSLQKNATTFDWTVINDALDICDEMGWKLRIRMQDKAFGGSGDQTKILPSHVEYFVASGGGRAATRHIDSWVDNYMELFTRMADLYESERMFDALSALGETSYQNPWTAIHPNNKTAKEIYRDKILALVTGIHAVFPTTPVLIGMNNPTESFFVNPFFDYALGNKGVALTWPDTWTDVENNVIQTWAKANHNTVAIYPSCQATHARTNCGEPDFRDCPYNPDAANIIKGCLNRIGVHSAVWNDDLGTGASSISSPIWLKNHVIPLIMNSPVTYLTSPPVNSRPAI